MRRALVTGAASGLAAGIAPALVSAGIGVVAITFRDTPAENTLEAIRRAGASADAQRVDFNDGESAVESALAKIVQRSGPFDTLIHAVGPMIVKPFERSTMEDYRAMFDGNVRSTVLSARAVLPGMRDAKFGRIVVFGMNGSSETRAYRNLALHQAAKSAVVAFAKCLAIEEAQYGITVNAIEPGDIRDKGASREEARARPGGTPRGRPGSYEDVADVVRFLVARERDFVTGAVIGVTGGLTAAAERKGQHP